MVLAFLFPCRVACGFLVELLELRLGQSHDLGRNIRPVETTKDEV